MASPDREEGGVLSEKATGPDLLGVVLKERAPGLGLAGSVGTSGHGVADRADGMVDPELGVELLGDARQSRSRA